MGRDLVTVVITCHNQARFLRSAIDSVQGQTVTDHELIVVDDGSTDETAVVVASVPGVRSIRQTNQGLSAARNAGWRAGRGRFVCFLDADDRLLPSALRAGLACATDQAGAAFVSGHYVVINAVGVQTSARHRPCVMADHYQALLRSNYIGMHATVLYRRETLERHGGFDPSLSACEDYDLYLRVARRESVRCHPEVVAQYRWHGTNMSRDSALMLRTALQVLDRQRAHVRGDAAQRQARRGGVAFWRRLYGEPLLDEVSRRVRARAPWSETARMLVVLLRCYPLGVARRAARVARRRLGDTRTRLA